MVIFVSGQNCGLHGKEGPIFKVFANFEHFGIFTIASGTMIA